jgi:Zn-dependent protease
MILTPSVLISNAIVLLVAMTVHEFAHAYVAYLNGDTTARDAGKMTLDPRANINPIGFLFGVLIGFGILGSAPIVPSRMRNPRWGTFQAVLAGPVSNLILAAMFAVPFRFGFLQPTQTVTSEIIPTVDFVLTQMVLLNVILCIFNLIPLFPLDGWTIVLAALPPGPSVWWQRNRQPSMYLFYGLIALSFLGLGFFDPLGFLVRNPSILITRTLLGL